MLAILKIEKKLMHIVIWSQNNKKLVQRHIQIIFVWMIGLIIFIKKHDLIKIKIRQVKYHRPQELNLGGQPIFMALVPHPTKLTYNLCKCVI